MKYAPYSFSKINTWKNCPRKFRYQYIDKIKTPPEESIPLAKGKFIHSLLEHAGDLKKVKADPEFRDYSKILGAQGIKENYKVYQTFRNSELGKKVLGLNQIFSELKLGINKNMEFYDYNSYQDPDLLLRGYIDAGFESNNKLLLVDWKTGKVPKDTEWGQLLYYSIGLFSKMPFDEITLAYVYVEHGVSKTKKVFRKDIKKYQQALSETIKPIEEDKVFEKKDHFCNWCKFQNHCLNDENDEASKLPWD